MKAIRNETYKIKDNDLNYLRSLNFKHIGDGIYIHDFPCYKWNGYITITGRFTAYDDKKDISIDIYQEDGRLYFPFYNEHNNNDVLKIVKANIKKEMIKCGIK